LNLSINIDPSPKELATIANMTADTVKMFGLKPSIAMVSYSNFGSNSHPSAVMLAIVASSFGEGSMFIERFKLILL
jgi:phosphotransacetylase